MQKFFLPLLFILFFLSIATDYYEIIAVLVSVLSLVLLLLKFGRGIALLELMGLYSCVIYLIFPLLGYSIYTNQNRMANLWVRYMPIESTQYFSFVLPGIIAYLIGMFMLSLKRRADEGYGIVPIINSIKLELANYKRAGWTLLVIGMSFFIIRKFLPDSLNFLGTIIHMFIFPGLLYIHFQPKFKGKVLVYVIVFSAVLMDAIQSGMFTLLFYMGITIASFFVINRRIKFHYKVLALVAAIFCTITLQLVKGALRKQTWGKGFSGSRVEIFQGEVLDKTANIRQVFSPDAFFPIYTRMNQGYNVALVMRRIPLMQEFDGGRSIMLTVSASFVPRFLWPDKPQAGGVYNMWHFAGFQLRGWSTNIGPVGEAYGNFGVTGGITYLFFFGLAISLVYRKIIKISKKYPLLLLWLPLLFFETIYSMENDTLQALNSLVKGGVFLFVLNIFFPSLFKSSNITHTATDENSGNLWNNRTGWSIP